MGAVTHIRMGTVDYKRIDPACLADARFIDLFHRRWDKAAAASFRSWPYFPALHREHEARRTSRAASQKRRNLLKVLLAARGRKCVQCGYKWCIQVDHIIPTTWGGTNDLFNLQLLCRWCNAGCGNMLPKLEYPS